MREIIELEEWMTPLELNESTEFETLTEGKVLNAIRWKLAKFSLRFLKESAIDEFLKAYYTDKDGKLAPKGKEWLAKSRKEKIKKMKDLADNLKDEEKQKVINSQAAKQCEKQAVKSGIFAGIFGASAQMAYLGSHGTSDMNKKFDADKSNTDTEDLRIDGSYSGTGESWGHVSGDYRGSTDSEGSIDFSTSSKGVGMGRDVPEFQGSREATQTGSHTHYDYGEQDVEFGHPNLPATTGYYNASQTVEMIKSTAEHGTEQQKRLIAKMFGYSDINKITSLDPNTLYSKIKVLDSDDKGVIAQIYMKSNPNVSDINLTGSGSGNISMSGKSRGFIGAATQSNTISSGDMRGSIANNAIPMYNLISTLLGALANIFLGIMWGSLILAGAHAVRSGFSIHKANTLRREEIMKQLMSSKRNLKEDFEFASIGALLNEFYY